MTLPDFLIIGAMKAGTTTLYRDLMTNPAFFFPYEKEKSNLLRDDVLSQAGRRDYERLFKRARPGQLCGIAPTRYTNLPDCPGVPRRALAVHGPGLRSIYIVREPIARTISHHYHEITAGTVQGSIDDVVRREPRFIDYSRYAMQVTPWIEAFGRGSVRIVRFEDYIADRRGTVTELCGFLGVPPRPELVDPDAAYNRSDAKPVPRGIAGGLRRNVLYRALLRPWLGADVKDRIRRALLPKAPPRPPPPRMDTVRFIVDQVHDDVERLQAIMGRHEPVWDLDAVFREHAAGAEAR